MLSVIRTFLLTIVATSCSLALYPGSTVYFFCDQGNYWKKAPLIEAIESHGVKVKETHTLANLKDVRYIICYEVPVRQKKRLAGYPKEQLVLVTWEPPAVLAYNFDRKNHALFGSVFTWHDNFTSQPHAHKVHYMVRRDMITSTVPFKEKKFSCLINKNIARSYPTQLISDRMATINFFDRNAPRDCDLYGPGWQAYTKMNRGKITGSNWRVTKIAQLKKYKFNICYENCAEMGYITEKIFDAFHAGVIPVYLGAPNIESYVPKKCFIDRRDFTSDTELYNFLKSIDQATYNRYIENIRAYLASDAAQKFTVEHYVKTITTQLFSKKTS